MKIAIVNTFSYRPHNEHLTFIESLIDKDEHEVFFIGCSGGASACNTLITKKRLSSKLITCLVCKGFGLESFKKTNTFIDVKSDKEVKIVDEDLPISTLFTASRTETPSEVKNIKSNLYYYDLSQSSNKAYHSFAKIIKENKIDLVFGFNGRMDFMRAVKNACIDNGIMFFGVERPWFGKGLLITPDEGPLGTKSLSAIWTKYIDRSLTDEQLGLSLGNIARRRLKLVKSEFMSFNDNHKKISWKTLNDNSDLKILFLPSSRMEHLSEFEYGENDWLHPLDGIKYLIENKKIRREDLIIRFHPIWGKKIFGKDAENITQYYVDFCEKYDIKYIRENEDVLTSNLIDECDVLILNGGSAFFEGSIIGKPIISLSNSFYSISNYEKKIYSTKDVTSFDLDRFLKSFNKENAVRKALRFSYCFQYRYHQFTEEVYHETALNVVFKESSFAKEKLRLMIENKKISPYDENYSKCSKAENDFIDKILSNSLKWDEFIDENEITTFYKIKRKNPLKQFISENYG